MWARVLCRDIEAQPGRMKVSVIIPCFNVAEHVQGALRSVLEQSHPDLDVLVLDDGSTDGTAAELERLMAAHPGRFRMQVGVNTGACAARNAGLKATRGEYVQFLDADDVLEPGKIGRQVAIAQREGQPDLVAGAYRNRYEDGRETLVKVRSGDPWEALLRTEMGTTSANLWKRSTLEQVGGWREDLGSSQDYDLMFRVLKAGGKVDWDQEVACTVLKRSTGSISRTHQRENWLRYLELRRAMREHLAGTDPVAHAGAIATADQYLFMAIRVLSKHDREAAFNEYDRTMQPGFVPQVSMATTRAYVAAFRMLGFRMAERIAGWLDTLRPPLSRA
jgi:glycosyltransferase involved in cell wall biosynthesis